ncbi:MAG: DUF2794 domain-containing protein [Actinomycetota bacterium]
MAKLIQMADHRARANLVHFNRTELTLLLNLYARRVAGGDWRDYAIDHGPDKAVFAVYRHTLDRPLYTVTKLPAGRFVVAAPERELARSASLSEALNALERGPRLVAP